MRVVWNVTLPFNPSSTQPTATANKDAAATSYIRGMQASFAVES